MKNQTVKNDLNFIIAQPNDLPDVFRLVDCYDDGMEIDRDRTKNSLRELVYAGGVFLVKKDDEVVGGLAGYAADSMFTADLIFNVMFFYIVPEHRRMTKRIIIEMELILITNSKATQIVFGVPAVSNMSNLYRFFRIIGYKPLEIHVTRRLSHVKENKPKIQTEINTPDAT